MINEVVNFSGFRQSVHHEPFRYVVIDEFLQKWALEAVLHEFPAQGDPQWRFYESIAVGERYEISNPNKLPPATREIVEVLAGSDMSNMLSNIFDVDQMIGKVKFSGLYMSCKNSFLPMHTDYGIYPLTGEYRRVNMLVYLNEFWKPSDGGELVLGEQEPVTIEPILNRAVIFETNSLSFHGCPNVWSSDVPRKSITIFYYSETKPNLFLTKYAQVKR